MIIPKSKKVTSKFTFEPFSHTSVYNVQTSNYVFIFFPDIRASKRAAERAKDEEDSSGKRRYTEGVRDKARERYDLLISTAFHSSVYDCTYSPNKMFPMFRVST